MELTFYEKAPIVLRYFAISEEAVTPNSDFSDKIDYHRSRISPVLFHASEAWHPQKPDLTNMQSFQKRVLKRVTPG